ncbi:MAG: glycosyltransferase family 1 protein [Kiritimatiellia bacterium]
MNRIAYNAMVLKEPYSGVEVTVHQLAAALAEFGTLPMDFYLPENHRSIPESPHITLRRSAAGAHSRLMRIMWEQLVLPFKLAHSGAQLLHAPAYVAPVAAPCPVVLTVHDLHVITHPQFCTASNRLHYSLMIPPSIRKAAAVIAFSDYTKSIIQKRFPDAAKKITVIPPGISPLFKRHTQSADSERVRHKYRLPASFLLFVGDLTERKNIQGVISAFGIVQTKRPNLHLILAGAVDRKTATTLDTQIRQYGLAQRISRIGYVETRELPFLYSMAQVFVFPSHDEGFGVPPLEAMACGCPVVCSGGAPVEICGEAVVACEPHDLSSIANAVTLLLDQPQFRQGKIDAGYKRAAEFTWQRAALRVEAVYRAVLAKSRSESLSNGRHLGS